MRSALLFLLMFLSLSGCGGSSSGKAVATVQSINLYTNNVGQIAKGTTLQLTVKATMSDGTTKDVTNGSVSYSGYDSSIVGVESATGVVTGIKAGNTNIIASYEGVNSNATLIKVTDATLTSITINSSLPKFALGTGTILTATGHFNDNTTQNITDQVVFNASNDGILLFKSGDDSITSEPYVIATGVGAGVTNVHAEFSDLASNSLPIQVTDATVDKVDVSTISGDINVPQGLGTLLVVKAELSDGSIQPIYQGVNFSSSDDNVASVDQYGVVTAKNKGTAIITVSYGGSTLKNLTLSQVSTQITITVTDAVVDHLTANISSSKLAKGTNAQLSVNAIMTDGNVKDITSSANYEVNPVDVLHISANGMVVADNKGNAEVTISYGKQSAILPVQVKLLRLIV